MKYSRFLCLLLALAACRGPLGQEDPEPTAVETVKADLLDVVFQKDGSAKNMSGSPVALSVVPGPGLMTYYNEDLGRYVAHFNAVPGESISDGYYVARYKDAADVRNGLADGHSLELVCRFDGPDNPALEIKPFSSMQSGGTGFLLTQTSGELTFLPNVSTTGASNWTWTRSGVKPEAGRFYHVVGVWNKEKGTSSVYVDGVLKATVPAKGEFVFPNSKNIYWFCIGGDAGSMTEAAWCGDVAVARIYNDVLQADEIRALYEASGVASARKAGFFIRDIAFSPYCYVPACYRYHIHGNGFRPGDQVVLNAGDGTFGLDTEVGSGEVKAVIPATVPTGTCTLLLRRGEESYPLGTARLTVGAAGKTIETRLVAHRGVHTGGIPENSLASLAKAREIGAWGSEFDLWISADNVIYINHDGTIDGKNIQFSTSADLASVRLSNGESLPTLETYLDKVCEDDRLVPVIEIKTHQERARNTRCVDDAVAMVKSKHLDDRAVWIAFDLDNCKRVHELLPGAMVQYLNGDRSPAELKALGIMGVDYQTGLVDAALVEKAHSLGMEVNVWTIKTVSEAHKFMALGCDILTTDIPEEILALLETEWVTAD